MNNEHSLNSSETTQLDRYVLRMPLVRGIFADWQRSCNLFCDRQPEDENPIFVTVHGTWARDAAWTRPQSKLLEALREKWPCAGIYRFRWSGVNGARPRIVASEVLSDCLTKLAARYPSSKIIIVSHSHGGNVVAWASTDANHTIAAAVYLNTPFIQVQRQSKPSSLWLKMLCFGLPFWLLIKLGGFTARFPDWSISKKVWGVPRSCYLLFGFATFILTFLLIPRKVHALRERLIDLSNCKRNIGKELVVLVIGDEAAVFLNGNYLMQLLARLLIFLYVVCLFVSITSHLLVPTSISQELLSNIDAYMVIFFFTILLVVVFVAGIGQGIVQGLIGLDSPVAVTPGPIGPNELAIVGWIRKSKMLNFRHSQVYETQEAIAMVTGWLETSVLRRDTNPRSSSTSHGW